VNKDVDYFCQIFCEEGERVDGIFVQVHTEPPQVALVGERWGCIRCATVIVSVLTRAEGYFENAT
jgi:hypothetical protein